MEKKTIKIPGAHPATEEGVLLYLYNHPKAKHTTVSIADDLDDDSRTREEFVAERKKLFSGLGTPDNFNPETVRVTRRLAEVQLDIESLIVKGLVDGEPTGKPGKITHEKIKLTKAGHKAALVAKSRVKAIELEITFTQPTEGRGRPPLKPDFGE
jgi:hypothetical protein